MCFREASATFSRTCLCSYRSLSVSLSIYTVVHASPTAKETKKQQNKNDDESTLEGVEGGLESIKPMACEIKNGFAIGERHTNIQTTQLI